MLSRRALIGTAIAGTGAALAACAPRPAAGTTRLDAVDVHPPGYPTVEAVAWIAAELARETGGRVRFWRGSGEYGRANGQPRQESGVAALCRGVGGVCQPYGHSW